MLFDKDMFMPEELLCKHVCIVMKIAHWLRYVRPSVCMCMFWCGFHQKIFSDMWYWDFYEITC